MQDLPRYRCSFTKVLWDENQETLVACNIHDSFLQSTKYSESSSYSSDGFLPGLKIFSAKSNYREGHLGDHARAKCGALQLLKATRWDFPCSRASPVRLVITQLANYIMVTFVILHLFTACIVSF